MGRTPPDGKDHSAAGGGTPPAAYGTRPPRKDGERIPSAEYAPYYGRRGPRYDGQAVSSADASSHGRRHRRTSGGRAGCFRGHFFDKAQRFPRFKKTFTTNAKRTIRFLRRCGER